ncbi:MAG: hypothetical protein ACREX3_25545 [Gammaproteobacteria bacterium]
MKHMTQAWIHLSRAALSLVRPLISGFGRLSLVLFRRHRVLGLKVIVADPRLDEQSCLQAIRAAVELLTELDPQGSILVQKYVKHVLVWPAHYTAYNSWGGIHFAARHLLGVAPAHVASALVHEATHLRIARFGIPYDPDLRGRIEAICVRAQADFLRKVLPDGARWADQVEAGPSEPWWSEADRRSDVRQSLQDAGLSSWLENVLVRQGRE